jgi:formylmethanofuran dehydrogenase subunit E
MNCSIPEETIEKVAAYHGHKCPGLAIGVRASELCLQKLGHNDQNALVAICETDMCGVDAISFLTGCTVGKGNLLFRDYGKMAFNFFKKETGECFRAVLNPDAYGRQGTEMVALMKKFLAGEANKDETRLNFQLRKQVEDNIYNQSLDELFKIEKPQIAMPRDAKVLQSIICDECGESTMESRIRLFDGRKMCIPCFNKVEQKI